MSLSVRASLPLLPEYVDSRLSASSGTLTWGSGAASGAPESSDLYLRTGSCFPVSGVEMQRGTGHSGPWESP